LKPRSDIQATPRFKVEACDRFDFLSQEYMQLFARSEATLFQHPVWLNLLYTALAPAVGADPIVVTMRANDNAQLVGVLPMVRLASGFVRRVEFADLGVSDYAAPIIDKAVVSLMKDEPGLSEAVLSAIGHTDLVRIDKTTGSAELVSALLGANNVREHNYAAHSITLPASFEQWREERDQHFIRHLERKRERIGRKRRVLALHEVTSSAEIDDVFELMKDYRRDRFADRRAIDLMQDPRYFEFYRQIATHGALKGGPGSTTVLTINDAAVGVSFGLSDSHTDLFVLIGYDVAEWRNYSLGLVMVEELIARSIENHKHFHDLTLGHGDYKTSFGAVASPMYSVRYPATPTGRAALAAADLNHTARQTAKKALAYRDGHLKPSPR
jgi:CelD/BcsL family acetyltransferase involved in cellulose biosynthesis